MNSRIVTFTAVMTQYRTKPSRLYTANFSPGIYPSGIILDASPGVQILVQRLPFLPFHLLD